MQIKLSERITKPDFQGESVFLPVGKPYLRALLRGKSAFRGGLPPAADALAQRAAQSQSAGAERLRLRGGTLPQPGCPVCPLPCRPYAGPVAVLCGHHAVRGGRPACRLPAAAGPIRGI